MFSASAHDLRHVTDKLASCIYLLVSVENTRTTAFGAVYNFHNTDAVYVCLDVPHGGKLIFSRLPSGYFQYPVGQTIFFYSDRFSWPSITSRALTVGKHVAWPGEINNHQL